MPSAIMITCMSLSFAGPKAVQVIKAWEELPKLYPPENWKLPPPAGYVGAIGMTKLGETM